MTFSVKLSFLFLLLITDMSVKCLRNDDLLTVVIVYRHGARSPDSFYSKDPYYYNNSIFTEGLGQLTNEGKNQHYALGQWLRSRYDGWLPSAYNRSDIYVQSTDYDRTLMSAQCNLAGLYPPSGNQIWNESVPKWQPVPIHTLPDKFDPILASGKPCNKFVKLRKQVDTAPYYVDLYTKYKDLFEYLSNKSGDNIKTFRDIKSLSDTLYVEREQYHLKLPAWTDQVYPSPLNDLVGHYFIQDTFTTTLARLTAGRFFDRIFTHFKNFDSGVVTGEPKVLMYSGHESTLSNLLHAMEAYDFARPPYASALIFELRKNSTGRGSYLNIMQKKGEMLDNISSRGCNLNCSLNDFGHSMKEIMINRIDWEKECNSAKCLVSSGKYMYIGIIFIYVYLSS